jgi:hypothetical protein
VVFYGELRSMERPENKGEVARYGDGAKSKNIITNDVLYRLSYCGPGGVSRDAARM